VSLKRNKGDVNKVFHLYRKLLLRRKIIKVICITHQYDENHNKDNAVKVAKHLRVAIENYP